MSSSRTEDSELTLTHHTLKKPPDGDQKPTAHPREPSPHQLPIQMRLMQYN